MAGTANQGYPGGYAGGVGPSPFNGGGGGGGAGAAGGNYPNTGVNGSTDHLQEQVAQDYKVI